MFVCLFVHVCVCVCVCVCVHMYPFLFHLRFAYGFGVQVFVLHDVSCLFPLTLCVTSYYLVRVPFVQLYISCLYKDVVCFFALFFIYASPLALVSEYPCRLLLDCLFFPGLVCRNPCART